MVPKPKSVKGTLDASEDFDFDDFCDFYDLSGHMDGDWFITDVCPVAGRRHEGSFRTGFFFDGNSLGFNCFAQGCDGCNMTVGQVIGYMNKEKGEPYKGEIWAHDDDDLLDGVQDADDFEDDEALPEVTQPQAKIIEPENIDVFLNSPAKKVKPEPKSDPEPEPEPTAEEDESDEEKAESDKPKADPAVYIAGSLPHGENGSIGLMVKNASDYDMVELQWLWPQRIPKGKITLFTGKPDSGKSLALLDFIARVSTGRDFADGSKNELGPRKILLAASEDDPVDTLIPRLKAAGADLTNIRIIEGTVVAMQKRKNDKVTRRRENLNLKRDVKLLLETIKEMPDLSLLALDPMTSFLGDADQNKDKEIRPIMDEITRVCNKSGITVVGIIHSNKRSDVDAVHKVSGAGSLAAAVRAVWGFSRDTKDKEVCHMAFVKGNLGKVKSGINYSIEDTHVDINGKSVGVPYILWGETIEEDADDLLKAERNNKDVKDTKSLIALALIRSMIPAKAKDIYAKAEAEGLTIPTLKSAKYKIEGIVTEKRGNEWWWFVRGADTAAKADRFNATADNLDTNDVL
jgi:KaiC/GvpD/RAD55 family RecA-like ATPase